jgi:NlpC/P60 family putative phage cell wall peptidase
MIPKEQLFSEARLSIGTPFKHQGRLRGAGLDCLGLLIVTLRGIGLAPEDEVTYPRIPDPVRLRAELDRQLVPDATPVVLPGRVGLFWITKDDMATHVGILLPEDRIVHAYADAKKVVETQLGEFWNSRLVKTYHIPGVEE